MTKYYLVALMLFAGELSAQSLVTDRPDQTESSVTVKKGSLQIESGLVLGFSENEREILAPSTLFRYGLGEGVELRILNQYENIKNRVNDQGTDGISDIELGTKIQLLNRNTHQTEMAFLVHLILPTGSKNLSTDKFGVVNKLALSHPINENIGLGYNIGYNNFGSGKGDLTYSIALGIGITDKLAVFLEPYGEVIEFDEHQAKFDAGFTYLINDGFQLDFSFGTGLNFEMNFMAAGLSVNLH